MTHKTTYRVNYADTDQMGYLYHGRYAVLYEIGRTEMLRSLGFTYANMETEHGVMMPVMSLNQRFVRPARYDEVLEITTTLRHPPGKTITFYVEIRNPGGKLVNGGSVKLCFVDAVTKRSCPVPPYLLEQVQPYFEV
ncbi:acyl-CoA thioesterase [Neolewinella antarctica]|uniref:Acyl-CoA thioester hydrolase n=1 Tax=Neolewinella antarctica TaxID=442734 RepID=A0ABX0XC17_9BACT|nr:thioesterase family protein [Neolewinella antarctica]NJC26806.1 acyl-CoA thioester hydrolase [Neolewinella antarctica]